MALSLDSFCWDWKIKSFLASRQRKKCMKGWGEVKARAKWGAVEMVTAMFLDWKIARKIKTRKVMTAICWSGCCEDSSLMHNSRFLFMSSFVFSLCQTKNYVVIFFFSFFSCSLSLQALSTSKNLSS